MEGSTKEFFRRWRSKLLLAVLRVPELVEYADDMGYGQFIIEVQNGKMVSIKPAPLMRFEKDIVAE